MPPIFRNSRRVTPEGSWHFTSSSFMPPPKGETFPSYSSIRNSRALYLDFAGQLDTNATETVSNIAGKPTRILAGQKYTTRIAGATPGPLQRKSLPKLRRAVRQAQIGLCGPYFFRVRMYLTRSSICSFVSFPSYAGILSLPLVITVSRSASDLL